MTDPYENLVNAIVLQAVKDYRDALKRLVMSKFHNYSFRNTVLIAMQKPDASLVAGFSAWKNNFERNVMKGQKAVSYTHLDVYKRQALNGHGPNYIRRRLEEEKIPCPTWWNLSLIHI